MQNVEKESKNETKTRSYAFGLKVIYFIDSLDKKDWVIQTLGRQLLRSGTSIGANITEAQAGSSRKDFTNFFSYALKSANETLFWLALFKDSGKTSPQSVNPLIQDAQELANMLGSSIITLKRKAG